MRIVMIPQAGIASKIAPVWLTGRKQPGKICRQAAVSRGLPNQSRIGVRKFL
jgi:hypothetical protein